MKAWMGSIRSGDPRKAMGGRSESLLSIGLIFLATLTGISLAAWSTRLGPGVGGDATIYLTSAQNFARGIGLGLVQPDGTFRLLPYSAPLFPLILSPFAAGGCDLTLVARWLNILLFGGLIILAGLVSLKMMGHKWAAALPAWLIACSPILLPVYSWAMAEPIALLLGFGGLAVILDNLDRKLTGRVGWPEVSGLLLGLSVAARYPAAAFLAAGLLFCLLWLRTSVKMRFFICLRIGLTGIVPLAIWVMMQLGQTASVSARSILSLEEMQQRFAIFWPQLNSAMLVWALPVSFQASPAYPGWINAILPAIVFIILGVLSIRLWKHEQASSTNRIVLSLWIFTGLYIGILLLVYLTTYPPITIDNRMLSPAHTAVIWITGLVLAEAIGCTKSRRWQVVLLIVLLGFVGWYGIRTVRIGQQNAQTGLGYNAIEWQQSHVIEAIKKLPEEQNLVTNETMAVLYLSGRVSKPVAEIYRDELAYPFTRYGDGPTGLDPAEAEFSRGDSLLVVFTTLENQFESIYGDQAAERTLQFTNGLREVMKGEDGAIYRYPLEPSR